MNKWGLTQIPFQFDRSKRRFGMCKYNRDRTVSLISLSRPLVALNDRDQVLDTIRHEIAHALNRQEALEANDVNRRKAHGWQWKNWCRKVGADPTRCYDSTVDQPPAKFVLRCSECGKEWQRNRRNRQYMNRVHRVGGCTGRLNYFLNRREKQVRSGLFTPKPTTFRVKPSDGPRGLVEALQKNTTTRSPSIGTRCQKDGG
jgi:predicted SprT family Zn-dependent metalloprotease